MVLSGFSMCNGYYEKIKNNEISIDDFYVRRFKKIWPFFAVMCLIDFVLSPSFSTLWETFANLTLCFGFLSDITFSVIGVGWFIGLVFVFYALFPFYCFLIGTKKRACFSFFVSLVLNYLCVNYFDVTRTNIIYSSMYFFAGGLIYLYKDEIMRIFDRKKILVLGILIFSLFGYFNGAFKSFWILLISIELILLFILNQRRVGWFISFISGISMEIYLCHMMFYRILEKLNLIHISTNELVSYCFVVGLVFIGAACFSYITSIFLKRMVSLCQTKS